MRKSVFTPLTVATVLLAVTFPSATTAIGLVNISMGTVIPGIGASYGGGSVQCRRYPAADCSTSPRQIIGARDFALDPTGRHLYVATYGLDYIGDCGDGPECKNVVVHDNSSRLVKYDLQNPAAEPVTLSYCGPWTRVEYDAKRKQVVALRRVNLKSDYHGTHYASEVVAFDAATKPAGDSHSKQCYNKVPLGSKPGTCACTFGLDPDNLNGRVIGRQGLKHDGIEPPSTMVLLGNSVLVGDQNQYCVVSFPLDGSAGSKTPGTPVAGTCGKSCGLQGCAGIGSKPVPAGKRLGEGRSSSLAYEMFKTPDGKLLLHDMNVETIDYGKSPKAKTQYITAPVNPRGSSLYEIPTFDPVSGDLLLLEKFSLAGQVLTATKKGGYGNARLAVPRLGGWYLDNDDMTPIRGVPLSWTYTATPKGQKNRNVLALVGLAYTGSGKFIDYALLQLKV